MKQKTVERNRDMLLEQHHKPGSDYEQTTADEYNMQTFYLYLAYSCPFVPMVDLSFAIDELIKMVKTWKQRRLNHKNIIKRSIHESI